MEKLKLVLESDIIYFQKKLLDWYNDFGRKFPWRSEKAPNYLLIISEIFLQRTKAETVATFLPEFIDKFPNWEYLVKATEQEIQDSLKPIGLYKQRGTRLYNLAQDLKKKNMEFPKERNELQDLSMFGQYITNAYELYILKKKSPLLDVNMSRVLERFFGKRNQADIRHDPYLQTLAYRVVNIKRSKDLNWAILDFASIVCKKRNPECYICILKQKCRKLKYG